MRSGEAADYVSNNILVIIDSLKDIPFDRLKGPVFSFNIEDLIILTNVSFLLPFS